MIKTRIYLTSGSHVDVQESFDEVNYVMMHSAPTWVLALVLVAALGLVVISTRYKKKCYVSRKRR